MIYQNKVLHQKKHFQTWHAQVTVRRCSFDPGLCMSEAALARGCAVGSKAL